MRLIVAFLFLCASAQAAEYQAGPRNYRAILGQLAAGDTLSLQAGDYTRGLPLLGLRGEPGRPVVIQGPAEGRRARFLARPGANTISLVDVEHLSLCHLELDGRNLPVDAVKAEGHARYAHFVTLEHLHIHDHAASQQNVGISSKCPAFGWVIRNNLIERVGTGLYLGGSDGSAPFVAGLIEGNTVRDTRGYNLQIKHQTIRPRQMPEPGVGHDTVIRRNLFAKENAQPGPLARPNVLVGHFPLEGDGIGDRYLIHANVFWQNPSEALFQGEGNLVLHNNVFVNRHGDAMRIQPHNHVPKQVDILYNTVLAKDIGISIRLKVGQIDSEPRRIALNLVFAGQPVLGGEQRNNLVGRWDSAARFVEKPFEHNLSINLTPKFTLSAANVTPLDLPAYPELHSDLFGERQPAERIGAIGRQGMPLERFLIDGH